MYKRQDIHIYCIGTSTPFQEGHFIFLCIILKKIVNLNVLNMSLKTFGLGFGLLKNISDKVLDSDIDKSLGLGLGFEVTKGDFVHLW